MDTLIELEVVIARLVERAREGKDAPDLRIAQRLASALKTEFVAGQKERQKVTAENLELKARIKVLEQQLAQLKASAAKSPVPGDEYVEHLGAAFVRKPSGRFADTPCCRQCKRPLKAVSPDMPYSCSRCQTFALFRPSELNDVLFTLKRS
jgi:hypothetical protein